MAEGKSDSIDLVMKSDVKRQYGESAEKPMAISEESTILEEKPFKKKTINYKKRFPEKLWEAASDESSDLISWAADGNSLFVHEDRFENEILETHPGLMMVKSFTNFRRQLREYGFEWRQNSIEMLFHFNHPCFRRDAPHLVKGIETWRRRNRAKQTTVSSAWKGSWSKKTFDVAACQDPGLPQGPSPLPTAQLPCPQQNQRGMTYHCMPAVQPTPAYFIPTPGHAQSQEFGGNGDYKKVDEINYVHPQGEPPCSSTHPTTPSGVQMVTMLPYFPQCSPWMPNYGPSICSFPMQAMAPQPDGSPQWMNNQTGSDSQWPSTSPEQPNKKKIKLDFGMKNIIV